MAAAGVPGPAIRAPCLAWCPRIVFQQAPISRIVVEDPTAYFANDGS
jgi:hypothetical protein